MATAVRVWPGALDAVQAAMLLIGSSVWAYVIGSACGIIATLDPARIEFRQTMDELNLFCKDQNMPTELSVKLRSYFRNTIYLVRSRRYEKLLQKMSTRLRGDAAYRMCEFRLRAVPFLVHPDLEPEFMCNLAIKYKTNVYSRLERIPCTELFVVERGVVAKRGRLGVAGVCFGKDVILSNDNLRDIGDAIALTFVQTISLSQKDILDLLPEYPQASPPPPLHPPPRPPFSTPKARAHPQLQPTLATHSRVHVPPHSHAHLMPTSHPHPLLARVRSPPLRAVCLRVRRPTTSCARLRYAWRSCARS